MNKFCKLSGNALKIFALIIMTIDHAGLILFDNNIYLRIIGRLAFPIFAYMVAEGCTHTKNIKKYFLALLAIGAGWQIIFYQLTGETTLNILLTFSLSVSIYTICKDMLSRNRVLFTGIFLLSLFCVFQYVLPQFNISFDYGYFGVLLPVVIAFTSGRDEKLFVAALWIILLSCVLGGTQMFSLFAMLPLMFYNGKRGVLNLKYLFYIYYPLHLFVLYFIKFWL